MDGGESSSSASSPPSSSAADQAWLQQVQAEIDGKAKPPGSLGSLETWGVKLAILQSTLKPQITSAHLLTFAADHGITASHPTVSAYPRHVSQAVFRAVASGGAASSVLCAANDCELNLVDVGLDADVEDVVGSTPCITVTHAKVRRGSRDMTKGPAMSQEECRAAQDVGKEAVDRAVHIGSNGNGSKRSAITICIGELGIGNTTSAAAIAAAITEEKPVKVCGRGTGLDDKGLEAKCRIVESALTVNDDLITREGKQGILQAVGGLEIAAMVGAYLQASELGLPVIVDGFISGAAALVALHLDIRVGRCLFWSHQSDEKGAQVILAAAAQATTIADMRLQDSSEAATSAAVHPPLHMGLHLGEGTGAVLALPLLRSAAVIMSNMVALKEIVT